MEKVYRKCAIKTSPRPLHPVPHYGQDYEKQKEA